MVCDASDSLVIKLDSVVNAASPTADLPLKVIILQTSNTCVSQKAPSPKLAAIANYLQLQVTYKLSVVALVTHVYGMI